jgi:hypothetical protein
MRHAVAVSVLFAVACGSGSSTSQVTAGANGDAAAPLTDANGTPFPDDVEGSAGPSDGTVPTTTSDASTDAAHDAEAGEASAFVSMGCTGRDPGNTSFARAVAFAIDTPFLGCLTTETDTRYEDFTTPATPGAGGYVVLTFSDVGPIAIDASVYVASDTSFSLFEMRAAHDGDGLVYWFAAAPATEYVVSVQDLFGEASYSAYTLTATFTPADDPHKPNDSEATATPLTLGTAVQSLAMHGYTSSDSLSDPGWTSYFQVTLGSTPATVSVTNVPAELTLEAQVYGNANENYDSLGFAQSTANGASLSFTTDQTIVPGPHYVVVEPVTNPNAYGSGSTPASYVTNPYTLVVTQ